MPRTYASESRLIHRRLASGKKPTTRVVTGKDEFNRPIVQQRTDVARNAQNVERAKTLSAKSDVVESYIDPKTGADSRERDNEGNFIEGTGTLFKNRVSGPLAPTLARRDSTEGPSTIVTNDALTRLRNQANGDSTNPNDELQLGSGQSPRAQGTGVIEQRRNARLDANNATQQQRQRNQLALRGIADPVGEKLASVRARIAQEEASGTHSYTVEEKAMMEQQAIAEGQAELQVQQQASDQATQQAQATGVAGDKTTQSKGQQQTQFTPEQSQQQAALQAAISGLPPEMQPFGQAIMQSLQSSQQGQSDLNRGLQAQGQSFQDQRDDLESTIRGIADRADQTFQAIDKNAQSIRDRNEQNLNEQEAAAKARLDWQEQEQTRKLNDQKKKAIDSKIAQLAMTGRANSSGGLKELEEVGREYEKAISDLQIEMGVQRTELAARFTALHTEVWNDYELGYENNRKDLTATLERISLQGLSSRQAIAKAEDNALQAFIQNTIGLRKEAAKSFQDGIIQIKDLIMGEKQWKAKEEANKLEREWQRYTFEQTMDFKEKDFQAGEEERALRRMEREDALDLKRDDNERYKTQAKISDLTRLMEGDRVVDQYKDARMSWDSLSTAFEQKNNPFRDRAMAKSYEKLVEVGSVVMPGEYADIVSNVPLASKIVGKLQKVATGGQNWTEQERVALRDISEQLFKAYQGRYQENAQKYLLQIGFHNANLSNPDHMITPEMLGLDLPGAAPDVESEFDSFKKLNMGGPFGGGSFSTTEDWVSNVGNGVVTQRFNTRIGYKVHGKNVHQGLDIDGRIGDPIPSFSGGRVISSRFKPGWGNQVVIQDEDGFRFQYSHLNDFKVREGDEVSPGHLLGGMGNTGHVIKGPGGDGSHLDFEIFDPRGNVIDPEQYHRYKRLAKSSLTS